jgi:hypothetical protein
MTTSTVPIPRHTRQADLVPQHELDATTALVVGCGAIGSWVSRFLAHLGLPRVILADPDAVAPENCVLQGFRAADIGRPKVDALAAAMKEIFPAMEVLACRDRFPRGPDDLLPELFTAGRSVIFVGTDNMTSRRAMFDAWCRIGPESSLFLDGRMAGLTCRVLACDDPADPYYWTTLFPDREAFPVRCTAKGTVFAAAHPAGRLVAQYVGWLNGRTVGDDPDFDLARDRAEDLLRLVVATPEPGTDARLAFSESDWDPTAEEPAIGPTSVSVSTSEVPQAA